MSGHTPRDDERLRALVDAAHEAARESLVRSTSGNFSARLDGGRVAISRARSLLRRLAERDTVVVDLESGELCASAASAHRPSRETPMHLAIYRARPDVQAVLHFQSLAATTLACREEPLPDTRFIPEIPVYVGKVADVRYLPPGSDDLATEAALGFRDPRVHLAQLRNHGQIVAGGSPDEAVERAVFFELACRMLLLSEPHAPLRRFLADELEVLSAY